MTTFATTTILTTNPTHSNVSTRPHFVSHVVNPTDIPTDVVGLGIISSASAVSKALASAAPPKYKKAPDAPKRFKSAFIIFSAEKHKEIKENFATQGRTEKVSVQVSNCGERRDFLRCLY